MKIFVTKKPNYKEQRKKLGSKSNENAMCNEESVDADKKHAYSM